MSRYDKINTPKELIDEVRLHGFSTNTDDICRAQDIFGRAPIKDLVALANDNGRNNENGEPDPEGTWSSGRQGTQSTFYSILFTIWHWEQAVRFYNDNTNPKMKELRAEADKARGLKKEVDNLTELLDAKHKCQEDAEIGHSRMQALMNAKTEENDRLKQEVMELKAKLYDMMMKEQEEKKC